MDRILNYTANENGISLYKLLGEHNYSDQIYKKLRKDVNLVHINGVPSFLNSILHEGDQVRIFLPEEKSSERILPVNLPFPIVYEDEDIAVINKPADMPIHPSLNNYDNSLGNSAAYYYQDAGSPFVYRCINRLDRDTSGLTIIAKNMLSASILSVQMKNRQISRTYYGIVKDYHGTLNKSGTINKPIGRLYTSTIERCIDYENGDVAITHYEIVKKKNEFALIKFKLETGRTHQIRVHMKSVGCPLIGDFLYNPEDNTMSRQALHAASLEFTHPVSKEHLNFEVPIPDDMAMVIN